MNWIYQDRIIEHIPEPYIGFVYIITNLTNNKKYIGKKLTQFKKSKPPLKGKTNRRKYTVESDWREYWGSSENLLEDIKTIGTEHFTREILYFCKSKAELSYLEALEQFNRRVLESDDYYNGIINVRVGTSKILRERLQEHAQQNQQKNTQSQRKIL
jgi:hypothetical protein